MYIQYSIHINPINDASIVATEAPNIPKLKKYIKIGSSIMFKIAVSINGFVALFTSPSERKIAANTDENNRNTVKLNEIVP